MLNCPFCRVDLGNLDDFPPNCPKCGKNLMLSDDAHASVQLVSDSAEPADSRLDATVESADSSLLPDGDEEPVREAAHAPGESQTFISDQWDDPAAGKTVQADERPRSDDPGRTVATDSEDEPSLGKTVQSEDFALEDAVATPRQADNERTVMSDEWDGPQPQATLLSDELPQDAIKTMQTMWSGAFEGKTTPGMTVKGRALGTDGGRSSLVIRERSLSTPGEQKPTGTAPEYELLKVLGEGGMGVVYDAKQMSVDRQVAVKMLKPKTAGDEKQRQKFLAEAVVTGELDHPNIVPIYDVGTSERGLLFYSMKKVNGTPWMKLIQQRPIAENLEILMKVADAVAFAHSRGVIHRDLKPENVMLGEYGEVLVMDWGLALPAPGYNKSDTISPAHSMGGTPAYMAPEMASGPLEKITFASDVYLLGAILYEILTGRAPHTGKNTMQCLFAAAKNEIRPAEKGGELMDIALKAMHTDPKARFPSVRDFQLAVREYSAHVESIALSTHAAEGLAEAEKNDDYNAYSRAIFGFDEALKQWPDNPRAKTGLSEARVKYASSALRRGDYGMGIGQLDPGHPDHQSLLAQLRAAQTERDARQHRLKTMKRVAVSLVAMVFVVVTGALVWIKGERDRADEERLKAVAAKTAADTAREKEEIAKKDAETQRDNAKTQEQIAKTARLKAEEEEGKAKQAQARAEEEEKNAKIAQANEEYEAYIARIGLAAAKIDENAFGTALKILKGCKPELRNWEWGRLMYLCGLSERSVDGEAPLDAVAFSGDGSRFVTGGWNRKVQIWDAATQKLVKEIPYGGLNVFAVAFSPDGRYVAAGGNDAAGFVRLWDVQTGAAVTTAAGFSGHGDAVHSLVFSRDGQTLLTASHDRTARLWDVASGKEIRKFAGHSWWVWSAAFSSDEKFIVTASHDGSAITWNAETGERLSQFLGHTGPVFSAAFSPTGDRVVTGGYDKRVLVWRPAEVQKFDFGKVARGKEVEPVRFRTLEGHGAPVRSVSFSQDGALILSGSHDNTVKVWDANSGRPLKTFRGHDSWVQACAFSPDRRTVVSAGHDHRATLWNITDYEEVRVLQGRVLSGHNDAVLSASFDRDGKNIVTASRDRSAKTWEFVTGREIRSFEEGHSFLATNALFFPGGKRLLTAAVDNTVRFWDVTSGTEISRLDNTGRSAAVAISPDGKRVLTGSDDKTGKERNAEKSAKLWDAETGKLVQSLVGHAFEVTAVTFSPDGKWIFTGDANGVGVLRTADSLKIVHRLHSHTRKISAAAFLPDSSRLLTASIDKTVAQWDVGTGKELLPLILKHSDAVVSLALIPGRRQVLTCCVEGDQPVRLWDLDQARVVASLPVGGETNAVAVTHDGRNALTVHSEERTVRLWELDSLREILAPQGKDRLGAFLDLKRTRGLLWSAAFSPDADSILTMGGNDARLWDRQNGNERMSFSPHGIVATAGFSPDASRIVTGSWDNSARVWDAKTGKDVRKLEGHTRSVNSAVYSPDGALILTASDDMTAILWDAQSGAIVRTLSGHTDRVQSAVFSPNGRQILTAGHDKTARLWNAATGEEIGKFEGHEWAVLSAVFSPDGAKVLTGSEDNLAILWDTATRQPLLPPLAGHTAPVASVTFLPDPNNPAGTRILTGSRDNTAKLWDALTGKEILTLKGHSQEVTCVNSSTSGRYVLTSSRDGTAVVWLADDWTREQQAKVAQGTGGR